MILEHYLVLSALIFCIGLYGILARKSLIAILLSMELVLNSVCLNLVAFSKYIMPVIGQVFVIFLIAIAVSEICIALAICINIYKLFKTSDVDSINIMKN